MSAVDPARSLPPFWLSLLACLPVGACLAILALPELSRGLSPTYRFLYLALFMLWAVPVAALQRALWRRRAPWWLAVAALTALTYGLSVLNNLAGAALSLARGGRWPEWELSQWVQGVDSCWLALLAFCALHAVLIHYGQLRDEQARTASALALARDAELRALRYQLHPHFLFNTLNAISALVADGRDRQARQMIARLGEFLRATLESPPAHEVAFSEELALTEVYLDIERARLGERLRLQWRIGPEALRAQVPHLLLQPLVENAIRHGIAPRSRPGRLEVTVQRDGERLCIELDNDGPEAGEAAAAGLTGASTALGLRNIGERLATLYPQAHRFQAEPREDGGYRVRIELPYREHAAAAAAAVEQAA